MRSIGCPLFWRAWAIVLLITSVLPLRAATPEQVEQALSKGKEFLYSRQKDGNWEEVPAPDPKLKDAVWDVKSGQWGGLTAIGTYALLAAGENAQDPRLISAIDFLKKANINGIYALGMRAQIWNLIPETPETRAAAKRDATLLLQGLGTKPPNKGFYMYTITGGFYHHSPSQYGVLGIWACAQAGIEIPSEYWTVVEEAWRGTQQASGGWSYLPKPSKEHPISASMTAAGVATLFITQDYLHVAEGASGRGNIRNDRIDNGLNWMAKHFGEVRDMYTWYGVERIGVASGYKYFGTTDWYAVGADQVLKQQSPQGAWDGYGGPTASTSFGLLFLSRGSAPVVINKLQYEVSGKDGNWNQRPRDAANVVRWIGKKTEHDLNWQIVNLNVSVDALHDAPILYIAGNQALTFTDEEESKLKQYVEQGGMIVANADTGAASFDTSIHKLGEKLFPEYKVRELPDEHVIYRNEQYRRTKWRTKPPVMGWSNGVRELMLLFPQTDPARAWQIMAADPRSEFFELMSDIVLYAVDKQNLQKKGQTFIIKEDPARKVTRNIRVARLKYDGNWDPEPGGWRRLAAVFHNQDAVNLEVKTIALGEGQLAETPKDAAPSARPSAKELRKMAFKRVPPAQIQASEGDEDKINALVQAKIAEIEAEMKAEDEKRMAASARFRVAHLTGTEKFEPTEAQIDELKKFLAGGGTLVIDAAGGSGEFAESAEKIIDRLSPDPSQHAKDLPPEHAIYHLQGMKPEDLVYRTYARKTLGHAGGPHLQGLEIGGRTAIIFSREDLSAGLVGQPIDGVTGYDPKSATALMSNIVLYANKAS